jgi:hypothetical protein
VRIEDKVAGPGDADLISDLNADFALEHVGIPVLVLVPV